MADLPNIIYNQFSEVLANLPTLKSTQISITLSIHYVMQIFHSLLLRAELRCGHTNGVSFLSLEDLVWNEVTK